MTSLDLPFIYPALFTVDWKLPNYFRTTLIFQQLKKGASMCLIFLGQKQILFFIFLRSALIFKSNPYFIQQNKTPLQYSGSFKSILLLY